MTKGLERSSAVARQYHCHHEILCWLMGCSARFSAAASQPPSLITITMAASSTAHLYSQGEGEFSCSNTTSGQEWILDAYRALEPRVSLRDGVVVHRRRRLVLSYDRMHQLLLLLLLRIFISINLTLLSHLLYYCNVSYSSATTSSCYYYSTIELSS